uniref:Peptidase S1 domain-containing protein n=1 Tax=Anopheles atroparvus TaxID=41427 RepID=A0AAG5DS92_ANOAO
MQATPLVLSLWAIVCCQTVAAMFNSCTNGDACIDISRCDFFGPNHKEPKKWTVSQKEGFKSRFCNKEQSSSGGNVYKVCCPKSRTTGVVKNRIDLLDLESCGPYTSDRIAFGKDAKLFEYPWMALLRSGREWICGGTLINKRYVLTAAHCVKNEVVDSVRLGEFELNRTIDCDMRGEVCADPPQDIPVERVIIHEEYSIRRKQHDIALLRLTREATMNDNVIPICLPVTPALQTKLPTFFVAGWGATENSVHSNKLQFTKLNLVPVNECQTQLRVEDRYVNLYDTQLCARGEEELSDNCVGDSGGPLKSVSVNARFVQYGVVSFGLKSCGKRTAPGVYTKVEHYLDWILNKLEE